MTAHSMKAIMDDCSVFGKYIFIESKKAREKYYNAGSESYVFEVSNNTYIIKGDSEALVMAGFRGLLTALSLSNSQLTYAQGVSVLGGIPVFQNRSEPEITFFNERFSL